MSRLRKNTRFTFTKSNSDAPMSPSDWQACEELLARMVARAIARENHPEWFEGDGGD